MSKGNGSEKNSIVNEYAAHIAGLKAEYNAAKARMIKDLAAGVESDAVSVLMAKRSKLQEYLKNRNVADLKAIALVYINSDYAKAIAEFQDDTSDKATKEKQALLLGKNKQADWVGIKANHSDLVIAITENRLDGKQFEEYEKPIDPLEVYNKVYGNTYSKLIDFLSALLPGKSRFVNKGMILAEFDQGRVRHNLWAIEPGKNIKYDGRTVGYYWLTDDNLRISVYNVRAPYASMLIVHNANPDVSDLFGFDLIENSQIPGKREAYVFVEKVS